MTELDELVSISNFNKNIKEVLVKYKSDYIEDKNLKNKYNEIYNNSDYIIKEYGEYHELYKQNELERNKIKNLSQTDYNIFNELNKNQLDDLSKYCYKEGYYLLYEKIEKYKEISIIPEISPNIFITRPAAAPF